LRAYQLGCLYDAWSDTYRDDLWQQAFAETGIDPEFYTLRERGAEELFPWDFLDIGISKRFLRREWEKGLQAVVTPNCREQCSGCGAAVYGCGVCMTHRGKKTGEEAQA
ncbi:MAG: B12-binding domain-containing radical SAM protein, partial [Oscillospiraceae bacterium]|nr:B12-binding domain-containing radical SAM protein [Oscillospiraceae bacterium]